MKKIQFDFGYWTEHVFMFTLLVAGLRLIFTAIMCRAIHWNVSLDQSDKCY